VVRDVKEDLFNFRADRPAWYLPYSQHNDGSPLNLAIKAAGDPSNLAVAIRNAVQAIDPDQAISNPATMESHLAGVLVTERFSAVLMGALAVLGLMLAALGLYGVMTYSVSQRTGELGLRMALGARPSDLFRLVIGQGVILVSTGLGIGLIGSLALTRFLSSALYNVSPTDPATFVIIALVLTVVALAACYLPARRAIRVDPMVVLRFE
jgi:putative ABC transport system permease protein